MRQTTITEVVTDTSPDAITARLREFSKDDPVLVLYDHVLSSDARKHIGEFHSEDVDYKPGDYDPEPPRFIIELPDDEDRDLAIYPEYEEVHSVHYGIYETDGERRLGEIVAVEPAGVT